MLVPPLAANLTVIKELLPVARCADLALQLRRSPEWRRRDLVVAMYDTPRRLSVLGPDGIEQAAPELVELYWDSSFRARIAEAAGTQDVEPVHHSVERYVANRMDAAGDVHGGHLDDYPVAATILVESPHPSDDSAWMVDERGEPQPIELAPGDCYVLDASASWHGVGPVERGGRLAVTFAFGLRGHSVVVTDSAQLIYGRTSSAAHD